jgi:glycosidase
MFCSLVAIAMAQAGPARDVTFTYRSDHELSSVSVAGEFNGWNRLANPLHVAGDKLTWTGVVPIQPGVYQYRFYLNRSDWVLDPAGTTFKDAAGHENSLITVTPAYYDNKPGKVGDGEITMEAVLHRPNAEDTCRLDRRTAYLKLRTRALDVGKVSIVVEGPTERKFPMRVISSDDIYDTWQGVIDIPADQKASYAFELQDGAATLRYGLTESMSGSFVQDLHAYAIPEALPWAEDAVFYHIFPDRFFNGDPANDGPDVQPWGTTPTYANRMGGDLKGIAKKLDYLKELGINALYLNPIFESGSNHAYNVYDYHNVDHRFGTNDELKELVSKAHEQNTRVIIDGVFNHSGTEFFAFKDLVKNGPDSPYKDWYFVLKYPLQVAPGQQTYRTFSTAQYMPKLNQDFPACRDYFLDVATSWIQNAGIDGWRLDDANEVSQEFWRHFRTAVRGAKKDAFILGEEWGDAHPWLQGDQHDSVMNYRWRDAVLKFFGSDTGSASEFENELRKVRDDYPPVLVNQMFNLLGSHDTERIRRVLKGDMARVAQAVVFQFTYPGMPSIYYGDEIGMDGGRDPDDRRCMIWDRSKWDMKIFGLHKDLIRLRKESPVLRRGNYQAIEGQLPAGVFGFKRSLNGKSLTVFLNRSSASVSIPVSASGVLIGPGKITDGKLNMGPDGYAVLE